MKQRAQHSMAACPGFSLLELIVVMALMSIILASVFSQIAQMQQRSRTEQIKLDIFQEARDFVDQFVRDMHQAGYPSVRMFDTSSWAIAVASPSSSDSRLATGIILIGPSEIQFEGDVNGDAQINVLDYKMAATGDNCPCLERGGIVKGSGSATFSNEVQNVQSAGTNADPIFVGYTAAGVAVTSADMTTNAGKQALATIKTVQIRIKMKALTVDPQTRLAPETTLGSQVTILNCSLATTGQSNSC